MKKWTVALASVALIAAGGPGAVAHAEPEPTTGVELNHPLTHAVAVDVTYDPLEPERIGLPALMELRARMWDRNPWFVAGHKYGETKAPYSGRLRDVAREHGSATKEEYVNSVVIDGELNKIALQRAVEETRHGTLTHQRPYNESCYFLGQSRGEQQCSSAFSARTASGYHGMAENGGTSSDLEALIVDQWGGRKEYDALNAAGGQSNAHNGHLHTLIDPAKRYHGFGRAVALVNGRAVVRTYSQAAYDRSGKLYQYSPGTYRQYIYRAADKGERPTGITTTTPQQDNPRGPSLNAGDGATGGSSANNVVAWLSVAVGVVSLIGWIISTGRQHGWIPF